MIKEYFANYFLHQADCRFDLKNNRMEVLRNGVEPWNVTLVDTGESTMTGGRLKRVREYIGDETFCFTYGDGVSDVNIRELVEFHREQQGARDADRHAAARPFRRADARRHADARRRVPREAGWRRRLGQRRLLRRSSRGRSTTSTDDATVWETGAAASGSRSDGALAAYKHRGFWQPMDTLRDKMILEELWASGKAPWKVWRRLESTCRLSHGESVLDANSSSAPQRLVTEAVDDSCVAP